MAQVFPTKTNLINTKKSLELARLGYDLMDRKKNILVREMMQNKFKSKSGRFMKKHILLSKKQASALATATVLHVPCRLKTI